MLCVSAGPDNGAPHNPIRPVFAGFLLTFSSTHKASTCDFPFFFGLFQQSSAHFVEVSRKSAHIQRRCATTDINSNNPREAAKTPVFASIRTKQRRSGTTPCGTCGSMLPAPEHAAGSPERGLGGFYPIAWRRHDATIQESTPLGWNRRALRPCHDGRHRGAVSGISRR